MADSKKLWADYNKDDDDDEPAKNSSQAEEEVKTVTKALSDAKLEEKREPTTGLNPADAEAEVTVEGVGIYRAAESFEELGLSPELLAGVYDMGFTKPSQIQARALPLSIGSRRNVIGQAQHGSGKTAAFSLSMLSNVDPSQKFPQALCVSPTRELAIQIYDVCVKLAKHTQIECFAAVKDSARGQLSAQVVVGTPGTLLAKIKHREFDSKKVRVFVVDEADNMMASRGHATDLKKLRGFLNKDVQVLLFSATFPKEVRRFSSALCTDAARITVKQEELSLDNIVQYSMHLPSPDDRFQALEDLYALLEIGQSIIFTATIAGAKDLANKLRANGRGATILHGGMAPKERDEAMDDFRTGKSVVLISTNVLSRGIDVRQIKVVINYDVPMKAGNTPDPETYIHRIGRSGRFGSKGVAINFTYDDLTARALDHIAQVFQSTVVPLPLDDYDKIQELVKEHLAVDA